MDIIKLPLSYFMDKLAAGEPFTFARYGDGEWLTILGYTGMRNSNGCTFTQELSVDLNAVLRRQNPYYHAILGIARRKKGDEIQRYLDGIGVTLDWYDGDLFLDESLKGNLFPLVEQIRERRILYVGNERLKGLNKRGIGFFSYTAYIEPPAQNAHAVKDEILSEVFKAVSRYKIDFIGWSAGLASKVFIDETFMRFPEVTQIDFGSLFDGYFEPLEHIRAMGRSGSRSYIRKGGYDWEELLRKNTGREVE